MMSAVLSNPGHPKYGVATIPFPIPRDQYTYCMDLLEARPRGITCACGSERYRMQVRPAAVDLICEDCGAKLRIGAATDEDLDRLCCRMTLQIPGKKE